MPQVRVIGADGQQLGIMNTQDALKLANENMLDLVEVAPLAKPPVCRIIDFSKYKYDQEKKEKEARKRQHIIKIKEIRLKPNIEEHDYQTKLHHLQRFLKNGDKAKITMMFRGRQLSHQEIGKAVLDRLTQDLSQISEVEKPPIRVGRNLVMMLMPK